MPAPVVLTVRLATVGLTAAMAGIHLHLWSTGYRHVPSIGVLFLLNAIIGIALAVALLVARGRLLPAVAAITALFTAGTLMALVLSLTTGFLGFKEFSGAPLLNDAVVVESLGIVASILLTLMTARSAEWWRRHFTLRLRTH